MVWSFEFVVGSDLGSDGSDFGFEPGSGPEGLPFESAFGFPSEPIVILDYILASTCPGFSGKSSRGLGRQDTRFSGIWTRVLLAATRPGSLTVESLETD